MARPKNDILKDMIAHVAARQFSEQGYDATTYSSIAKECGISRNLVQYHWPKKELLAIKYIDKLLSQCVDDLGLKDKDLLGNYDHIAEVGTRFFETLLAEEGTRRFLKDIIVDRNLTETILSFNLKWTTSHIGLRDFTYDAVQHAIVSGMGGFYSLLHWSMKYKQPLDISAEMRRLGEALRIAVG